MFLKKYHLIKETLWNFQRKLQFFNENHKEITLFRNSSNAIEKYNREAAEKTCFGASKYTENAIFWTKNNQKNWYLWY